MTLALECAAFALGAVLSIEMIAALYGVIDLRYTLGTAYPKVLLRVLGWGVAILALFRLLEWPYRTAFASGLAAFLVFHLGLHVLRGLVFRPRDRPPR